MPYHVVIFARSPRFGRVKTRLARDIGAVETLRFYRNTLSALCRRLSPQGNFRLMIAMTPDRATLRGRGLLARPVMEMDQGGGDLGARMSRTFRDLPPGPAVLIGSDIPEISRVHLAAAFRALGDADAVFGPAADGGYWLIGLKRRQQVPPDFLKNVRWSHPETLKDTLQSLPKNWKVAYINQLDDIDSGDSYRDWRERERNAAASPLARSDLARSGIRRD